MIFFIDSVHTKKKNSLLSLWRKNLLSKYYSTRVPEYRVPEYPGTVSATVPDKNVSTTGIQLGVSK